MALHASTPAPPHERMLRLLLKYKEAAVTVEGLPFSQFKQLWQAEGLSEIHRDCPDDRDPNGYLQNLFASALGYVHDKFDIYMRVGCTFLLYCLHGSQTEQPLRPIQLVQDLWDPMLRLRQSVGSQSPDALCVLERMHARSAFEYCLLDATGPGTTVGGESASNNLITRWLGSASILPSPFTRVRTYY